MVENLAVLGLATFPLPAPVLRLLDIDPDHWLEQGVLRVEGDGYVLADNWLRQRAQGLISNRMAVEDALADALTRANVGEGRWENIARHRIRVRIPIVRCHTPSSGCSGYGGPLHRCTGLAHGHRPAQA